MNLEMVVHEMYKCKRDLKSSFCDNWYLDGSEKLANQMLENNKEGVDNLNIMLGFSILNLEHSIDDNPSDLHVCIHDIQIYIAQWLLRFLKNIQ